MFKPNTLPLWIMCADGDGDSGGSGSSGSGTGTAPAGDTPGSTAPGTTEPNDAKPGEKPGRVEFTAEQQAEVNRIVQERLARAKDNTPDNVRELQEKASRWDAAQEQLSDAQKLQADLAAAVKRAEDAESRLAERDAADQVRELTAEVAKDKKVPADILRGTTREELEAHAEQLRSAGLGTDQQSTGPRSSAFHRAGSGDGAPKLPATKGIGTLRSAYSNT